MITLKGYYILYTCYHCNNYNYAAIYGFRSIDLVYILHNIVVNENFHNGRNFVAPNFY